MTQSSTNSLDFTSDISVSLATSAYAGISFTPEKRATQTRDEYSASLRQDYETFKEHAIKGGTLALLEEEFSRYRAGYRAYYTAWLSSKSRCMSTMITGPSNFPTRRNQKRMEIEHRRCEALIEFRKRAVDAIIRNLRPDLRPIMSGDVDATERLEDKITTAEAVQARMKAANVAIRKHAKAGAAAQVAALVALGFEEGKAKLLLEPDFCGRIGFADYELTNNGANIRRMKERLAKVSRDQAKEETAVDGEHARLEDSPADNRVRLFFPGKPAEEVRAKLKKNGFRWSPTIGAWQAYRNYWSQQTAREVAGVVEKTKEETVNV